MIPRIITDTIPDEMSAVNEMIRSQLYSQVDLIKDVSSYIIKGGGKRLRPALVILSSLASGYSGGNDHLKLAAVVEFIHTATLLHDDVVDDSSLRRGNATANVVFDNSATVLVGDFLYSRAFQMVAELHNHRVTEALANATNTIAEGEVQQLVSLQDPDVSEETYYKIVRSKTAQLFEAAGRLGAIIGNIQEDVQEALADYGSHMGTAFQLIDDALDYSGDTTKIGKKLGDDLSQGKVTLPLIHAMSSGSKQEAKLIRDIILTRSNVDMVNVIEVLEKRGSISYVYGKADYEVERAVDALQNVPDTRFKKCMIDLALFAVERNQ